MNAEIGIYLEGGRAWYTECAAEYADEIYDLWQKRNKPMDVGWHISANDFIAEYSKGEDGFETADMLVDYHPSAKWRIGLIELLDIYVFTYSRKEKGQANWSPMMLRFRDALDEEYEEDFSEDFKRQKVKEFPDPQSDKDLIEFLYLNGCDTGWNWGKNGMTNAAFLHSQARDYFREYF